MRDYNVWSKKYNVPKKGIVHLLVVDRNWSRAECQLEDVGLSIEGWTKEKRTGFGLPDRSAIYRVEGKNAYIFQKEDTKDTGEHDEESQECGEGSGDTQGVHPEV